MGEMAEYFNDFARLAVHADMDDWAHVQLYGEECPRCQRHVDPEDLIMVGEAPFACVFCVPPDVSFVERSSNP